MKKKRERREGRKERRRGEKEEGGEKEKKRGETETERWQVPLGTVASQLYPAQDSKLPVPFSVFALPASSEVTREQEKERFTHAKTILIRRLIFWANTGTTINLKFL